MDGQAGCPVRNERGVALLITLLVTTILIALVFEFAYGTRVSLRAATNFRDSQRAYFLARSGVNVFVRYNKEIRQTTTPGEWIPVPIISEGDTNIRIKWEDERGKFNLNSIDIDPGKKWIEALFSKEGIGTDVFDAIVEARKTKTFQLVSELHAFMQDEEFVKVERYLSTGYPSYTDSMINFNTAPEKVLVAMGCTSDDTQAIIERRANDPYTSSTLDQLKAHLPASLQTINAAGNLSSTIYKIYSSTTVGGYTRQAEAVVDLQQAGNPKMRYWRIL